MAPKESKPCPAMTSKEAEFFYRVAQNLGEKPEVNWDKVAADLGFKDANIAKVRFRQIKVKLEKAEAEMAAADAGASGNVHDGFSSVSPPAPKVPGSDEVKGGRVRKPSSTSTAAAPGTGPGRARGRPRREPGAPVTPRKRSQAEHATVADPRWQQMLDFGDDSEDEAAIKSFRIKTKEDNVDEEKSSAEMDV